MNLLKSDVRCCNPFPNGRATNKDEYMFGDFANFDAKIGCQLPYGNVL